MDQKTWSKTRGIQSAFNGHSGAFEGIRYAREGIQPLRATGACELPRRRPRSARLRRDRLLRLKF